MNEIKNRKIMKMYRAVGGEPMNRGQITGALPKGTILKGQYEIRQVLGRGGFGVIYQAFDKNLQVMVAVKEIYSNNTEERKRAIREARITASLYELDGIVTARDFFCENETTYIVMEYVQGVSVKGYVMTHGHMDGQEVLRKMKPLLYSLQQIHDKGILHRDISVDNIMLTKNGRLKLIDFGAASNLNPDNGNNHTITIKRGFTAVEQHRASEKLGTWTDVYSLCASMYFMITGIVPQDAMERWLNDQLTPLNEIYGTGLTRAQSEAIMQGMAVDKADRLKSVNALSKLLYDEVELENNLLQQKTGRAYVWTRIGHTRTMRREIANVFNTSRKNSRHNIRRMIWIMPCAIVVVIGALGLFHRVYPMQTGSAPDAAFRQVIRTVSDQERGATAIPSALPNKKSVPPTGVKNTSESTIAVEADKDAKASEAPQNGKDAKASKRSQADKKGTTQASAKPSKKSSAQVSRKAASPARGKSNAVTNRKSSDKAVSSKKSAKESAKESKTTTQNKKDSSGSTTKKNRSPKKYEGNLDELFE